MADFQGRTAMVTGAGRGIGRAIALELAAGGATVVVVARSTEQLDETAELIGKNGGNAVVVTADIADERQLDDLLETVRDKVGRVDILVNNAATVEPVGPSATVDMQRWAAALTLNVVTVARLSFALLPDMVSAGWGRIVNISSGIVEHPQGMLGANAYATSKAAIEAHTINFAAEIADSGVTVNAYRPGGVDTAMQEWIRNQDPDEIGAGLHGYFMSSLESGNLLTPEDSAHALVPRINGSATGQIWDVSDEDADKD